MATNNTSFIDFLKSFEKKKVRITCNNHISYIASNLKIINSNSITFTDKYGSFVWLSVSEIVRLEEVRHE